MKSGMKPILFLIACGAFSLTGWRLAASSTLLSEHSRPDSGQRQTQALRTNETPENAPEKSEDSFVLPMTKDMALHKILAKTRTTDLWALLQTAGQLDGPTRWAISGELVDRLGWTAWDQALRLQDTASKSSSAEYILGHLSQRDPWKAFEVWKEQRKNFGSSWGGDVVCSALVAAGEVSATSLIEVMHSSEATDNLTECFLKYGPDFDFPAVMEYLTHSEKPPLVKPYNLLSEWGRQSPRSASQWIADHPEALATNGHVEELLRTITHLDSGTPGRSEAIEILGRLPSDFLENAWGSQWGEGSGKISATELEAAKAMGQSDTYLVSSLVCTVVTDSIDPSWRQIPVEDRMNLLAQAEQKLSPEGDLTPIQKLKRDRWRKMVIDL